jgi:hypothetical protein
MTVGDITPTAGAPFDDLARLGIDPAPNLERARRAGRRRARQPRPDTTYAKEQL